MALSGTTGKRDLQNDKVFQGLQKKKRCALCLQDFYVEELPGAISYKSVLELRHKWGVDVKKNGRMPSPSLLYQRVSLCIFCMQFFDSTSGEEEPSSSSSPSSGGPGGAGGASLSKSGKQRQNLDHSVSHH
eukprot:TRINITY_DN784_c0_g1_i8.p4 TRINITY_DN784_c0_g1~~TRINITY_DN784_c0_g1_i8.p4  ORF type:complete len:131 (+),score=26.57 TRINITY_DN784_c0_g1_i8:176-568(+)